MLLLLLLLLLPFAAALERVVAPVACCWDCLWVAPAAAAAAAAGVAGVAAAGVATAAVGEVPVPLAARALARVVTIGVLAGATVLL
jgi:hypothetical protein